MEARDIYSLAPTPVTHGESGPVDRNLCTLISPNYGGVLPDGDMVPCMAKCFSINANVKIEDGEDLVMHWAPENGGATQGEIFKITPTALTYVGPIKAAINSDSYNKTKCVASVITVFSDTISTTNTTLSGRISAVALFNPINFLPTWDTMGQYIVDPKAAKINCSLAEGLVLITNPNAKRVTYNTELHDGHNDEFYMNQTPLLDASASRSVAVNTTVQESFTFETGPTLAFASGNYYAIIKVYLLELDDMMKVSGNVSIRFLNRAGTAIRTIYTSYQMDSENARTPFGVFQVKPPAGTVAIRVVVTENLTNVDTGAGHSIETWCTIWSTNPLMQDDNTVKYLLYVQGNTGSKNINVSGWSQYQCYPKNINLQLATCRRVMAYNPSVFEAFAVLLDSLDYFNLVATREEYSRMLMILPHLTLPNVAVLADRAASASMALLPLIRKGISTLKSVGISPARLMRKGTGYLHRIADEGIDKLESLGFATASTSMDKWAHPQPVENPLNEYPEDVCWVDGAWVPGDDQDDYTPRPNTFAAHASMAEPMKAHGGQEKFMNDDEIAALMDGDDVEIAAEDDQVAINNPLPEKVKKFVVKKEPFPEDYYKMCIQNTYKYASNWKLMMSQHPKADWDTKSMRASFFYAVGDYNSLGKRCIPCAVLVSNFALEGHTYRPFGRWNIDSHFDDKQPLEKNYGYTTFKTLKAMLVTSSIVRSLYPLYSPTYKAKSEKVRLWISLHTAEPDIDIVDTSFAGALYAALWADDPLYAYEAGVTVASVRVVDTNLAFNVASLETPSNLDLKATASRIRTKEEDNYFINCTYSPEYMPMCIIAPAAEYVAIVIKNLSSLGLMGCDGRKMGNGALYIGTTPQMLINAPRKYVRVTKVTTVGGVDYTYDARALLLTLLKENSKLDWFPDLISWAETLPRVMSKNTLGVIKRFLALNPTPAELAAYDSISRGKTTFNHLQEKLDPDAYNRVSAVYSALKQLIDVAYPVKKAKKDTPTVQPTQIKDEDYVASLVTPQTQVRLSPGNRDRLRRGVSLRRSEVEDPKIDM